MPSCDQHQPQQRHSHAHGLPCVPCLICHDLKPPNYQVPLATCLPPDNLASHVRDALSQRLTFSLSTAIWSAKCMSSKREYWSAPRSTFGSPLGAMPGYSFRSSGSCSHGSNVENLQSPVSFATGSHSHSNEHLAFITLHQVWLMSMVNARCGQCPLWSTRGFNSNSTPAPFMKRTAKTDSRTWQFDTSSNSAKCNCWVFQQLCKHPEADG